MHTGYLCLLQYSQLYGLTFKTFERLFIPKNKHFYFRGTYQVEPIILHCFEFLSQNDFPKVKFIWGTSLIFSTVIWSYGTPFLNWRQKDEWNSLGGSQVLYLRYIVQM